ncbi:MAG: CDP-glycerol glycerophosphotransferase family protein [Lachnospiraceae bacterium]|nr:CDP-glycerol glycerophosphotransferase family protein [Lachnospiraceae bacterium]
MVRRIVKKIILLYYRILTVLLPVRKDVIVFQSNLGRNYTGNPRAIYEKFVELGLDKTYRCYYILDEPERYAHLLPGRVQIIKNARLRYYYVMAVAGVWISDTRFQNYIKKRKKTCYIQTWHGTPLKRLALDLESLHMAGNETLEEYKEAFRVNAATWDYLISQNPFSTAIFRQAFDFKGLMLPVGYPRNDALFSWRMPEEADTMKVRARKERCALRMQQEKQRLGFPVDKKIMLYAPTWRDDAFYDAASYRFATAMDFEKMYQAFGKEYILVAKFHYMVREKEAFDRYPEFLYPVDAGVDIADLYPLADLLITDYSSAMFDYSILKRPMYFFAYDLENYENALRGFYFDFLKEAPGPVVSTTEALIEAILEGEEVYRQKHGESYDAFCRKYNPYDTGHASEKVIKIIFSWRTK